MALAAPPWNTSFEPGMWSKTAVRCRKRQVSQRQIVTSSSFPSLGKRTNRYDGSLGITTRFRTVRRFDSSGPFTI